MNSRNSRIAAFVATAALATVSAGLSAAEFTAWSAPLNAEDPAVFPGSGDVNTSRGDGCPILDPYTNDLLIARTTDAGDLDIWRAKWNGSGWDTAINIGAPVNTPGNEFCPSPARGNRLFFVRGPAGFLAPGVPNPGDIYVARETRNGTTVMGYANVERLPNPINSGEQEWSPSYYEEADGTPVLYFSSTRLGSQDIFFSRNWGAPQLAQGLNADPATSANDARPNVRRDGLEIVFDSNRTGGQGATDIWTASRASPSDPWGTPTPITQINSPSGESRASLSWDGSTLVFGSGRTGSGDVYVASRARAGR